MTTPTYKLSPSDLTFLWDECKRCFYLKVVSKFSRPAIPFPVIFTKIDGLMKYYYQSRSAIELTPELPPGTILPGNPWVQSLPITLHGHTVQCYLAGKYDSAIHFVDGTYGLVDFKTSMPHTAHIGFYGRQLRAYAYALEHPAPGKYSLSPISRMGLLVVAPNAIDKTLSGEIAYIGKMTWQEIPVDETAFLAFLSEVLTVLELPEPPVAAETCAWCQYRKEARENGL